MPSNDLGIWDGAPESRPTLSAFPIQCLRSSLIQLLITSGPSSIFTLLHPCSGVLLGKVISQAHGNGLVWSGSYLWHARTIHFLIYSNFSTFTSAKPLVRIKTSTQYWSWTTFAVSPTHDWKSSIQHMQYCYQEYSRVMLSQRALIICIVFWLWFSHGRLFAWVYELRTTL